MRLSHAIDALRQDDLAGALRILVPLWRRRPCARIGDLVLLIGDRLLAREPWEETGYALVQRALEAAEGNDPATTSHVFDVLRRNPGKAAPLAGRLGVAMADPRFARELVRWVGDPPSRNQPFWSQAAKLLLGPQDEGCRGALEAIARGQGLGGLPKTSQTVLRRAARNSLTRVKPSPPHGPTSLARLDALEALLAEEVEEPTADLRALHQRATRRPLQPAAVAVWADALQEAGDPRGELALLQLRGLGRRTDASTRGRIESLVRQHRQDWLAPLGRGVVVSRCTFEAGLLRKLVVRDRPLKPSVELGSVEEVVLTGASWEALKVEGLRPRRVSGIRTWAALQASLAIGATEVVIRELESATVADWLLERTRVDLLDLAHPAALPTLQALLGDVEEVVLRVAMEDFHAGMQALRGWSGPRRTVRMPNLRWSGGGQGEELVVGRLGRDQLAALRPVLTDPSATVRTLPSFRGTLPG